MGIDQIELFVKLIDVILVDGWVKFSGKLGFSTGKVNQAVLKLTES